MLGTKVVDCIAVLLYVWRSPHSLVVPVPPGAVLASSTGTYSFSAVDMFYSVDLLVVQIGSSVSVLRRQVLRGL